MEILAICDDYPKEEISREWEIASNPKDCQTDHDVKMLLNKKMDSDEKVVRQTLVKVWTKILEKYARAGVHIPSVEEVRRELLDTGVDAAVSAVVDEHWFVFSWMIQDKIREKVERGLQRFDLGGFVADVRAAQNDPGKLKHLREEIKHYVLFEDF